MKLLFSFRDFSAVPHIPPYDTVKVVRYAWNYIGGPSTAMLEAPAGDDMLEFIKLLRCPVEIWDEDGMPYWWGYVRRISLPFGNVSLGLSLDGMYNRVAATYPTLADGDAIATGQATTAWAENVYSADEFGDKEYLLSIFDGTADLAETARDNMLALQGWPVVAVSMGGAGGKVTLECAGWWETLDWKYYTNASTVAVSTSDQIRSIVSSCGQFITATTIGTESGVDTNPLQDGSLTGKRLVEGFMQSGVSGGLRYWAYVNRSREILMDQVPVQAVKYLMTSKGALEDKLGIPVKPQMCTVGAWAELKGLPPVLGGVGVLRPFLIGSAEYTAATGQTVYRPADMPNAYAFTELVV